MENRGHGGSCCGEFHLVNFNSGTLYQFKRSIAYLKNQKGLLTEITITSGQIKYNPERVAYLKELGFKQVNKFLNKNSGNYCHVLHHYNDFDFDEGNWDYEEEQVGDDIEF